MASLSAVEPMAELKELHHDDGSQSKVVRYLQARVDEFRELSELRQKGWTSKDGDDFFAKQRRQADRPDARTVQWFHQMMIKIAKEMNRQTAAFTIPNLGDRQPNILDFCAAPGGFLEVAMWNHPNAAARAYSLPECDGGHEFRLPAELNVEVKFLDITMLAGDMGIIWIPPDHPDVKKFLPREFARDSMYDLVLCDGQVLRTHHRASYREKRESRRLALTQLALGLEHLHAGGTMVVLLHKVEAWDTCYLLYTFNKFSSVKLFKPTTAHAKRSSFYMVATDIDSNNLEAISAVDAWKTMWKVATFGSEDQYMEALQDSESNVSTVLDTFGAELVNLGREVWRIQAEALAKETWTQ